MHARGGGGAGFCQEWNRGAYAAKGWRIAARATTPRAIFLGGGGGPRSVANAASAQLAAAMSRTGTLCDQCSIPGARSMGLPTLCFAYLRDAGNPDHAVAAGGPMAQVVEHLAEVPQKR